MISTSYPCELLQRSRLCANIFELVFSRPRNFSFQPGQCIRLLDRSQERDYSLTNAPQETSLRLCIRRVRKGSFSKKLLEAAIGSCFEFTGPHGHFTYRHSGRHAVFVATGTGVAPFASMAGAGVGGFTLLHGVRSADELFYTDLFQRKAAAYVACISHKAVAKNRLFHGRVTAYVAQKLPSGTYDFYLCGRREMIRDITWLIDDRFPDSRVYSEIFF